ncbi:hypothetical protein [Saccharopolyspora gloriosae]|nr:hypothetical protein [Saccharopolyspora gloriosae]
MIAEAQGTRAQAGLPPNRAGGAETGEVAAFAGPGADRVETDLHPVYGG